MPLFTELTGRGVITVSGADRIAFLQGLVSNDVALVADGRAIWAALLTPQGKFRHDFIITADKETLRLDCEGGDQLMDLGRTLRRFVLRADVTLGINGDLGCFVVWGDGADKIMAESAGAIADPRLPALGYRLLAPASVARAAMQTIAADEADRAAWDHHRITLGVPDGSRDLQQDKAILLENGFDELHGIDWNKGCYMGQELTARTKYRGLVKKRLMPVRISGPMPGEGSQILADGKDAGTLYSTSGDVGLALLRLDAIQKKAALHAGDAALVPVPPDWLTLPD